MRVIVTGGAGFIGSHTCVELLKALHSVTVLDNLSRGIAQGIAAAEKLTGKAIEFHRIDLLDADDFDRVFDDSVDAVIHFAALKSVPESVRRPLDYYQNNVAGTVNLLRAMQRHGCREACLQLIVYSLR